MTTHFQLFALKDDADELQIKTRYKQLAARCHPDKGGSAALMVMIQNSYHKLILGEGAQPIHPPKFQQDSKQLASLKKTIHQQQFAIQKLTIAVAKHQQSNETKNIKQRLIPLIWALLILLNIVFASAWYHSRQDFAPMPEAQINRPKTALISQVAPLPDDSDKLYKQWELKQKLRLSVARQQYLETDFELSKQLIRELLGEDEWSRLSQDQQQFLSQHQISPKLSFGKQPLRVNFDQLTPEDPWIELDLKINSEY